MRMNAISSSIITCQFCGAFHPWICVFPHHDASNSAGMVRTGACIVCEEIKFLPILPSFERKNANKILFFCIYTFLRIFSSHYDLQAGDNIS